MICTATLKALEPISHGDTLTGIDNSTNTRLFMRSLVYVNGIPARVPDVSENSLRSVVFRKTLADHLFHAVGVEPKSLPKSVVALFFSGGNLQKGAKAPGNEHEIGREVFTAFPSLELVSGAVDNFVLPPGRLRLAAWPVAQEYVQFLEHVAPQEIVEEAKQISVFDLISEETRTRGTGGQSEGNQMIYTYEVMAAGAKVFLRCSLDPNASDLCQSALGFALENWDGFFGGQGRQGRGLMAVEGHNFPSGTVYKAYIDDNKEALVAWVNNGTLGAQRQLCGGT